MPSKAETISRWSEPAAAHPDQTSETSMSIAAAMAKVWALLDRLISGASRTSPTGSMSSTKPGPVLELIRHNYPSLTDEEVREVMDET
jgi:hypothetical protein